MRFAEMPIVKERRRNVILRQRMLELCSGSDTAATEARERCAVDILFWVNYFGWTYDPRRKGSKAVPFVTYEYQDKAILRICDDIREGRDVVILKSRDMGASWIVMLIATWFTQFHPLTSGLAVSRNEDYVDAPNDPKSLFWKADFLLKHQPRWLKPRNMKRTALHLGNEDNGSVIDGESTTGEVGRGDRRTYILMDEFGSFDVKSGYNALAATQSATNCRIFNSTPKGQGNAFYDVARNGANDIIRMHWSEHPEKNRGLYTSVRSSETGKMEVKLLDDFRGIVEFRSKGDGGSRKVAYPEDYPFVLDGKKRSPWYDLQCARAVTQQEIAQELDIDFAGSDYQFFDPVAVETYKQRYCREPESTADVIYDEQALIFRALDFKADGKLSLFQMPKGNRWEVGRRFVIGVDISAGMGASNSTAAVYDATTHEKVAEYADPNVKPDDFARLCIVIARWFNFATIVPDRTGPTGEVFVARVKTDAPDIEIYRVRETNKVGIHQSEKQGVFLTPQMKTKILFQYRDAIGNVMIVNRSSVAMDETLCFICRTDGTIEHSSAQNTNDPSGASSNHGDRVIADALANLVFFENREVDVAENVEIPPGSLAWRMAQAQAEENESAADVLDGKWNV